MTVLQNGKFFPTYWASDSVEKSRHLVLDYESYDFESRWSNETKFTIELIARHTSLSSFGRVLDYGAGVGRVSKAIIEKFGCSVDAYEPAEDIRKHSIEYVRNDKFSTILEPATYDLIVCTWVALLVDDLDGLYSTFKSLLNPGGKVLIVDYKHQLLTQDGINYTRVVNGLVRTKLEQYFKLTASGKVPDAFINRDWTKANTFDWGDTFWAVAEASNAL